MLWKKSKHRDEPDLDVFTADALIHALELYKESLCCDTVIEEMETWLLEKIDGLNLTRPYYWYTLTMSRVYRLFDWRYNL